jgi:hypothetical protein
MQDKPKHEAVPAAPDQKPPMAPASGSAGPPVARAGTAADLGILLAAADNEGLVVLNGKPESLLASNLLEPAAAPSMRYAYTLTEEGWQVLRASSVSRTSDERSSGD